MSIAARDKCGLLVAVSICFILILIFVSLLTGKIALAQRSRCPDTGALTNQTKQHTSERPTLHTNTSGHKRTRGQKAFCTTSQHFTSCFACSTILEAKEAKSEVVSACAKGFLATGIHSWLYGWRADRLGIARSL